MMRSLLRDLFIVLLVVSFMCELLRWFSSFMDCFSLAYESSSIVVLAPLWTVYMVNLGIFFNNVNSLL